MGRVVETVNWLLLVPYCYVAYFLGMSVGASAKTPLAAAAFFWLYLAIFPAAAVVCGLAARTVRLGGRGGAALAVSLMPAGVLAALWLLFPAFVSLLSRVFG